MAFFKKLSLRGQLLLLVCGVVIAGFAVTLGVLSQRMTQIQKAVALEYVEELTNRYSRQAMTPLNHAINVTNIMAKTYEAMVLAGNTDRATANAMMRQILDANPGIVSTWTIWEPDAFDGRDAEYAGTAAHDATGRFVPYWIQDGKGGHLSDAIVAYDKENYYLLPQRTGKIAMQEPYVYNYGGREILQTAVTVPIMVRGKFLGVAGVSVPLTNLQKMVEEISIYDSGYVSLISNAGTLVGDGEAAVLGKRIDAAGRFESAMAQEMLTAMQAGRPYAASFADPRLGGGMADLVMVPMHMTLIDTPWAFAAVVPQDKVLQEVRNMQWLAALLGVISVLLTSAGLALAVQRLVIVPLGGEPRDAAALAARVAAGDLSQSIRVQPGDHVSLMYQLQSMQRSLAQLVGQVRDGAQSVATASAQITMGNQELSGRTESQASALEQTAASMEELGTTVRQNAEHAHNASALAQEASLVAEQGGQTVQQVVQAMHGISASSNQIADIIGVIDSIAFQTNILALNAAVEAARAGEQGRGFAVVAGEVRTLAQRSAEAAKEIKTLIQSSAQQVHQGSTHVDAAGQTMQQVVQSIQRVATIMQEISAASRAQSASVGQVGEAITEMDQTTQQNAALVEEMTAAASSLQQQADGLVQHVTVFKL